MGQWYDDPRGRYEKRWHDGEQWTAHVASGGQTSTDPLGVGPSPTAAPSGGVPAPPSPPFPGSTPSPAWSGSSPAGAVKPDNYLVWGILTTFFCCLPFGIVSIVQASKVDSAWTMGQYDEARRLSDSAKKWATVAAVASLIVIAIYVIFWVAILGALASA